MTPRHQRELDRELTRLAIREIHVAQMGLSAVAAWTATYPDCATMPAKLRGVVDELERVAGKLANANSRLDIRMAIQDLRGAEKALRAHSALLGERGGLETAAEHVSRQADTLLDLLRALGVSITDTQPIAESDLPKRAK